MSEIVTIKRFDGGIADDYVNGASGECSISKQFDLLSYPFRLQPLRGMEDRSEAVDTGLAQMLYANGAIYGIGLDNPANPTNGELYWLSGFGASDVFASGSTPQLSGAVQTAASGHFDFLVYFPEMQAARKVYWASTNLIMASDPDMDNSADSEALTFTTIGQGLVHPKDKILYFPYQESSTPATKIYSIAVHASDPFGTVNTGAFTGIPSRYRSFCLAAYGDFLAIPMTILGKLENSLVGLWNRDTSITTFSQIIDWGVGQLKVLNSLSGALVGISVFGSSDANDIVHQDQDKIQIKVWDGGAEPTLIKEIIATRLTATQPSCTLNHRVNFIHNNRLYFSVNIVNGDSDANYYGLWSVGKNKLGQWTVLLERVAKNDNSETGVLAAALAGDFLSTVYTSGGNISYTINGNTLSSIYGATSVYETCINPQMPIKDIRKKKKLEGIYIKTLPLPAAGQIVVKCRVNSNKDDSWSYTAITGTTDDENLFEAVVNTDGSKFPDFKDIEFRIESTGGATVTEFGYKYDTLTSQI